MHPRLWFSRQRPARSHALGIELIDGRLFDDRDREGTVPVVVVNQAFANRFWPDGSALGKRMRVFDDEYPWMTIIGVVADRTRP